MRAPNPLEVAELHAAETGQPIRYTGPAAARLGWLQIIGPNERTLCGLPLQPHWLVQQRGERTVCRQCLARLSEVNNGPPNAW